MTFRSASYTKEGSLSGAGSQVIATATLTALTWEIREWDSDSFWASGSPTRFTAPVTGYYTVILSFAWKHLTSSATTTLHRAEIWKNGQASNSQCLAKEAGPDSSSTSSTIRPAHNLSIITYLLTGDYVEGYVHQNSGGNLNIEDADASPSRFQIKLEHMGTLAF